MATLVLTTFIVLNQHTAKAPTLRDIRRVPPPSNEAYYYY